MTCSNWPRSGTDENRLAQVDRFGEQREAAARDHAARRAQRLHEALVGGRAELEVAVADGLRPPAAHAVDEAGHARCPQRLELARFSPLEYTTRCSPRSLRASAISGRTIGGTSVVPLRAIGGPVEGRDDVLDRARDHRAGDRAREHEVVALRADDLAVVAAAVEHVDVVDRDERRAGHAREQSRERLEVGDRRRRAATRAPPTSTCARRRAARACRACTFWSTVSQRRICPSPIAKVGPKTFLTLRQVVAQVAERRARGDRPGRRGARAAARSRPASASRGPSPRR